MACSHEAYTYFTCTLGSFACSIRVVCFRTSFPVIDQQRNIKKNWHFSLNAPYAKRGLLGHGHALPCC